jgi:predicted MFS family arabinose efflux permease
VIIGQSLIGAAMGMFHPYFPYKAIQVAPKDQTTSALSLVSSGFRMGTFVSPFFFLYAGSLANVTTIRGEFLMTAVIFCGTMIFTVLVFLRKNPLEPTEQAESAEST